MKHSLCVALALVFPLAVHAQQLGPEQKRLHAIYKELIETNTTHSAGDTTLAAQRMARHLRDAGFADAELLVLEPFPKKGNLVARLKGDGSKRPLLLLAHLDVVEALRADWQTDPFVLQETNALPTDDFYKRLQARVAKSEHFPVGSAAHASWKFLRYGGPMRALGSGVVSFQIRSNRVLNALTRAESSLRKTVSSL